MGRWVGYRVTGRKVWTSKALESERVLLLTRTTPVEECAKRTDGLTLFVAPLKDPAVTIRPIPKLGRNAVASCEVTYDGLYVDTRDRVGEEGRGFGYLLDGLNAERVLVAAEALGTGRAALRRAVAYAKVRTVFGRPIGQNQGISFPLAEAHARLGAAELAIRQASWRIDHGLPAGSRPTWPSSSPPRPVSRPPTRPCRPTAGSATRRNTTSSATGARRG